MIMVEQGAHDFADPAFPETVVALPLAVESRCNWSRTSGDRHHRLTSEAGRMLVVPADIETRWEVDARRLILVLAVPNETVRGILGTSCPSHIGRAFWSLAEDTWTDPHIELLLKQLWDCLEQTDPVSALLSDGMLTSIVARMLIRSGTDIGDNAPVFLPEWRLKKVRNFVHANLGGEIGLDDLAEVAGLSRRHFARSFHQETGQTPHRWLMQQRLERAKTMLSDTEMSLCEIAECCGFASQSHLTTALKQSSGITPHRWRQRHAR